MSLANSSLVFSLENREAAHELCWKEDVHVSEEADFALAPPAIRNKNRAIRNLLWIPLPQDKQIAQEFSLSIGRPTSVQIVENPGKWNEQVIEYPELAHFLDSDTNNEMLKRLFRAISLKDDEGVGHLLRFALNLNAIGIFGAPLHVAAQTGNPVLVKALLDRGAYAGLPNKEGKTPLHIAAEWGWADTADIIAEYGAPLDAVDNIGWTALHYACKEGHQQCVAMLLARGSNLDHPTARGFTPLHFATTTKDLANSISLIETLMKFGPKLNVQAKNGRTVLHEAVLLQRVETVRILLHAGIDTDVADENGEYPIMFAIQNGDRASMQMLFQRRVNVCNKKGVYASDMLKSGVDHETQRLLVNYLERFGDGSSELEKRMGMRGYSAKNNDQTNKNKDDHTLIATKKTKDAMNVTTLEILEDTSPEEQVAILLKEREKLQEALTRKDREHSSIMETMKRLEGERQSRIAALQEELYLLKKRSGNTENPTPALISPLGEESVSPRRNSNDHLPSEPPHQTSPRKFADPIDDENTTTTLSQDDDIIDLVSPSTKEHSVTRLISASALFSPK